MAGNRKLFSQCILSGLGFDFLWISTIMSVINDIKSRLVVLYLEFVQESFYLRG